MILLIDNYDSFSYNLYQLIGTIDSDVQVIRNDACTVADIERMAPERIVISPGPGRPADAGICIELIRTLDGRIPLLGVCLGHQAICEAYGARVGYAAHLMHGKSSTVKLASECPLFHGLPTHISAARYHSLSVDEATLPRCLRITARADDGEVMAVQHTQDPVYGVQFHPESIMTPDGSHLLENFLKGSRQ
jgi:anthranilate synthase component 2